MDNYIYLLNSGIILAFLSFFYWLFLRKETFFLANRWILLGNIALALIIPLLPLPEIVVPLKTDLIESFQPAKTTFTESSEIIDNEPIAQSYELNLENTITSISNQNESEIIAIKVAPISIWDVLKWFYLIGFSIMVFRFLIQLFSVIFQIKNSEITKGAGYFLATNNKDISPFSFWKYIVINPNKYDEPSFLHILEHERIHILQKHTFDIVLAELFLVVQWCNPLAWWHRYMINQNLEFLVDQTLLENGENKQSYQYHLVQIAVPNSPLSISSNYNSSQLKNRIKMMNLQRSSLSAIWKYALLLPIAFLLLLAFTESPTGQGLDNISDTPKNGKQLIPNELEEIYLILTEQATVEEITQVQKELLKYGINFTFDKLNYNDNKRIKEVSATFGEGGNTVTGSWPKDRIGYGYFIFYKNGKTNKLEIKVELKDVKIKNYIENNPAIKIFSLGLDYSPKGLEKLKEEDRKSEIILKKKHLKKINARDYIGYPNTNTRVINNITIEKIQDLKQGLVDDPAKEHLYFLDGIPTDKTVLDLAPEKMLSLEIKEVQHIKLDADGNEVDATFSKREICIKRKAEKNKINPLPDNQQIIKELKEIFIILTEEASLEEIHTIQEKLLVYNIKLTINQIKYNPAKTKILSISTTFESNGNKSTSSWNNNSKGYNYLVYGDFPKTNSFATGSGKKILDKINLNNPQSEVFILGRKTNEETLNFLIQQQKNNAQPKLAPKKESNNLYKKGEGLNSTAIKIDPTKIKIPKEFRPNGTTKVFKIKDINIKENNDLKIYNKWGEIIFEAMPYKNDWKGLDDNGQLIKKGTYYVVLKVSNVAKPIQSYLKISDGKVKGKINKHTVTETYNIQNVTPDVLESLKKEFKNSSNIDYYFMVNDVYFNEKALNTPIQKIKEIVVVSDGYMKMEENSNPIERIITKRNIYIKKYENDKETNREKSIDTFTFVHQPNAIHYVILPCIPCNKKDLIQTKDFLSTSISMTEGNHRISNIYLGSDTNQPILIIRKFNNFEQAFILTKHLKGLSDKHKPSKFTPYPISQENYRNVLRQKLIQAYQNFYKENISNE